MKRAMAVMIPNVDLLLGGSLMPVIGLGTASFPPPPPDTIRAVVLDAIALGYRHFDTASIYDTERPLGDAIAEALRRGLIQSRSELFITSKVWCTETYTDRVLPSLQKSLRNLGLEYLDLYLVHWPVSLKPTEMFFPIETEGMMPFDYRAVWEAMEECHKLGLAKSIGVSNFSCKKLEQILSFANIPPSVNQVEMHPLWQQKKLMEFCKEKGIVITAYSALGGYGHVWGNNDVIGCKVLKEIASARGKTVAQVCLRWLYQQGGTFIVKTFKTERMKENLGIFDWGLTEEELKKIRELPQKRGNRAEDFISPNGPFKSVEELWDGEI
ncbi:deoxymugineic acid synthase 1-D-like [Dioscorea cayenensis subsp. rotundata]|uniref:Deoxymugineic acid synthase 1-D-like n=1 Tax=Dioscorea cayennensis subsp. rotundata TaxID=55577 RepID=A0AB40CYH7_DIOCR|nr:deoxymugineic acid synthase 1-D-like [Dioscorea cayenensis subsp. rotundata]